MLGRWVLSLALFKDRQRKLVSPLGSEYRVDSCFHWFLSGESSRACLEALWLHGTIRGSRFWLDPESTLLLIHFWLCWPPSVFNWMNDNRKPVKTMQLKGDVVEFKCKCRQATAFLVELQGFSGRRWHLCMICSSSIQQETEQESK